jgi:hypothetical protein
MTEIELPQEASHVSSPTTETEAKNLLRIWWEAAKV